MPKKSQPPPTPGEQLVASIVAEMLEEGIEPDAKETALLEAARQLVDRLDVLERLIAEDGVRLVSKTGVVRMHPAVSEHRQQAVALSKVLAAIVVGDSTAGKNPVKQRAARARWDRRDREREARALASVTAFDG